MSAMLLTRLKIADLTAWTALDAGRKLLPEGYAWSRLVREELYLFEPADGSQAAAFESPLIRAVERSNFFVNPNKEQYRFLPSAGRGASLAPPEGAWGILARSRDDTRDEGLRARLLREHPLEGLGAIRRARLWWLWTRGPGGGAAVEPLYRAIGPLVGARQGLLVNPQAEADLRIEGPTAWRAIEDFLTAPRSAAGRAA